MNRYFLYAIATIAAVLISKKIFKTRAMDDLEAHMDGQQGIARINRISSTVANNAAPAIATFGELPYQTVSKDPIEGTGTSKQAGMAPFRANDL